MSGLKRTVTIERAVATKRPKTTDSLSRDVAKLKRQVNSNKPEVRQITYTVPIGGGAVPAPLILPDKVDGDEIKLHRITLGWSLPATRSVTDKVYWTVHSPKQGYSAEAGFADADTNSLDSYLGHPDQTKQRVWLKSHDNVNSIGVADGLPANIFYQLGNIYMLDKKFSIPMKCGTDALDDTTILHNQVYFSGSPAGGVATARVTLWYTDA